MTLTATTLAANLGADATEMTLAAAISDDTHEREFVVQIETEYILVERRVAKTNPQIARGFLGTERAAHASGEDVTPVVLVAQTDAPVDPPAETPGGGGGGVTVTVPPAAAVPVTNFNMPGATIADGTATVLTPSILGPFAVSGTDAALAADWVVLAVLPEGIIVQQVFVFCSVSFVDTGRLQVYAGDVGVSGGTIWTAGTSPGPEASGGTTPRANPSQPSSNYNEIAGGAVLTGPNASIYATIDSEGSAGAADIYVAIATPAS